MPTSEPSAPRFAPNWREGDTWTVRYHDVGPSWAKAKPDIEALVIHEFDWVYTVDLHTPSLVRISCYTRANWIWYLTFTPDGRLLKLENPSGNDPPANPDVPFFEAQRSLQEEGVSIWPRFPLEEDFEVDDSSPRQRSREVGSDLEVVVSRAEPSSVEHPSTRTATMRWQQGRPWWSTLRIDVEYPNDKGVEGFEPYVELEGEVIAWPKSTP